MKYNVSKYNYTVFSFSLKKILFEKFVFFHRVSNIFAFYISASDFLKRALKYPNGEIHTNTTWTNLLGMKESFYQSKL